MIRIIISLSLLLCGATLAQYEKADTTVSQDGRSISLHLFHFSTKNHHLKVITTTDNTGTALGKNSAIAGVAIGHPPGGLHFTLQNGHAQIRKHAAQKSPQAAVGPILLEDGKPNNNVDSKQHARRTFILHDGAEAWAIGYAPSVTEKQLASALSQLIKQNNFSYRHAYQLNAGNQSSFWVLNRGYQDLYLKEINPPEAILCIQRR